MSTTMSSSKCKSPDDEDFDCEILCFSLLIVGLGIFATYSFFLTMYVCFRKNRRAVTVKGDDNVLDDADSLKQKDPDSPQMPSGAQCGNSFKRKSILRRSLKGRSSRLSKRLADPTRHLAMTSKYSPCNFQKEISGPADMLDDESSPYTEMRALQDPSPAALASKYTRVYPNVADVWKDSMRLDHDAPVCPPRRRDDAPNAANPENTDAWFPVYANYRSELPVADQQDEVFFRGLMSQRDSEVRKRRLQDEQDKASDYVTCKTLIYPSHPKLQSSDHRDIPTRPDYPVESFASKYTDRGREMANSGHVEEDQQCYLRPMINTQAPYADRYMDGNQIYINYQRDDSYSESARSRLLDLEPAEDEEYKNLPSPPAVPKQIHTTHIETVDPAMPRPFYVNDPKRRKSISSAELSRLMGQDKEATNPGNIDQGHAPSPVPTATSNGYIGMRPITRTRRLNSEINFSRKSPDHYRRGVASGRSSIARQNSFPSPVLIASSRRPMRPLSRMESDRETYLTPSLERHTIYRAELGNSCRDLREVRYSKEEADRSHAEKDRHLSNSCDILNGV